MSDRLEVFVGTVWNRTDPGAMPVDLWAPVYDEPPVDAAEGQLVAVEGVVYIRVQGQWLVYG